MRRIVWLAAVGVGAAAGGPAAAQPSFGSASPGPTVSPFINLLRPGNPALNYYGLVRPQQEFRQNVAGLQQDFRSGQQAGGFQGVDPLAPQPSLPGTGHRSTFLNTAGYFLTVGGRGGGTTGGGTVGGVMAPTRPTGGAGQTGAPSRPTAGRR